MRVICFFLLIIFINSAVYAKKPIIDEAEEIYKSYGQAIYQIQVIDRVSNKKTSIGSGFQISNKGHIATNYHVVSGVIQKPEHNRIEYLTDDGKRGSLKVIFADVVHDLAIVQKKEHETETPIWLKLGKSELPKGSKIFSLGNPHDIGFTIIEGTYNGISKKSLYEKIHFSGSLNPGMSGGPALDHSGNVIGVNVATAGNQISFLVPVEHLKNLLEKSLSMKGDFLKQADKIIQEQLQKNQKRFFSDLLKNDWEQMSFGSVNLPSSLSEVFKCWGGKRHEDKDLYKHFYSVCSSQDSLYLKHDFRTGLIRYNYDYLEAKDELNIMRFYSLYQTLYGRPGGAYYYNAKESDVTEFVCNDNFVNFAKKKWKSSFCIRQYKKYSDLYDLNLYMAMLNEGKKGLLVSLVAQGIDKENSLLLSQKFMENIAPLAEIKGNEHD